MQRIAFSGLAGIGLVLVGTSAFAAVAPYSNNFSGSGDNTALAVETPDAKWAVVDGVYRFSTASTVNEASAATLPLTNLASDSFTMQTQFTVTSTGNVNSAAQTLGFGFLGVTSGLSGSNSSSAYYLADFSYADSGGAEGLLRILSLGNSNDFTNTNGSADANAGSATLGVVLNTTYTLRLVATRAGSTISMSLGLYDAAGTTQIGTLASATDTSPLTGTNFGYRNRHSIGGGSINIDFDNFSVVPEPTSLGLLGAATLLLRRRRH